MTEAGRKDHCRGVNRTCQRTPSRLVTSGLLSARLKMGSKGIYIYTKVKEKIITFVALYYPVNNK